VLEVGDIPCSKNLARWCCDPVCIRPNHRVAASSTRTPELTLRLMRSHRLSRVGAQKPSQQQSKLGKTTQTILSELRKGHSHSEIASDLAMSRRWVCEVAKRLRGGRPIKSTVPRHRKAGVLDRGIGSSIWLLQIEGRIPLHLYRALRKRLSDVDQQENVPTSD